MADYKIEKIPSKDGKAEYRAFAEIGLFLFDSGLMDTEQEAIHGLIISLVRNMPQFHNKVEKHRENQNLIANLTYEETRILNNFGYVKLSNGHLHYHGHDPNALQRIY
jgi:phosphoglycerate dehydrogenase-like enzyme